MKYRSSLTHQHTQKKRNGYLYKSNANEQVEKFGDCKRLPVYADNRSGTSMMGGDAWRMGLMFFVYAIY